jgi:hypothetical protein
MRKMKRLTSLKFRTIVCSAAILLFAAQTACAEDPPSQAKIDAAVEKAENFLGKMAGANLNNSREGELVAIALLHAGTPAANEPIATIVRSVVRKSTAHEVLENYRISLAIILLNKVDPVKYQSNIAELAQRLVDGQCVSGQWTYTSAQGKAPPAPNSAGCVELKRPGKLYLAATGDNSNTQFAVMGLWAATKSGVRVPEETWQLAETWFKNSQGRDGSWGYQGAGSRRSLRPEGLCRRSR